MKTSYTRLTDLPSRRSNDNTKSPLRTEISAIEQSFKKEFGKPMACFLEQFDCTGIYRKINIWNISPKKLTTLHWFALFTLNHEREKQIQNKIKLKAKLKVYTNV